MKKTLTIIMALALLIALGTVALASTAQPARGDATITLREGDNSIIVEPPGPTDPTDPEYDEWWSDFKGEGNLPFGTQYLSVNNQVFESEEDNYLFVGVMGNVLEPFTNQVMLSIDRFAAGASRETHVINNFVLTLNSNRPDSDGQNATQIDIEDEVILAPEEGGERGMPIKLMEITNATMYRAGVDLDGTLSVLAGEMLAAEAATAVIRVAHQDPPENP